MFTGIIEEIGIVNNLERGQNSVKISINAKKVLEDVSVGDSIAVNGVCLTVTNFNSNGFSADVVHESLNRSGLSFLKRGSEVNLERAMPANGRFGGHIVSGHVDGLGEITEITRDDNATWYTVKAEDNILKYIVEKGSITIDGISLTVAKISSGDFSVSIIPHTVSVTTLKNLKIGDKVNLESDIIGKYVEKLLFNKEVKESKLSQDFLYKCGF